jgi:hypothetical protein
LLLPAITQVAKRGDAGTKLRTLKNQTPVLIRLLGGRNAGFCGQHEDDVAALPQRPVIWREHFLAIIALTSQDTLLPVFRIQVRHAGH